MHLICSPPGEWTSRIVHLLNDQHMGVVTAAASLIDALVKKNPEEYKGCISLAVSRLSRVGTRQHIVHTIIGIVNPISHSIFFSWLPRGRGWITPPLWKIHFGVSEPNSFLHSHLYIYRQLKSKRTSLYLQNSRDEVRSKFGRKLDESVPNLKIKN